MTCPHHWLIEPAEARPGEYAHGVCKWCGERREDFVKVWRSDLEARALRIRQERVGLEALA